MIWFGGLSLIVHLLINLYVFAKRKIFGWLNVPLAPSNGWMTRPNPGAAVLAGFVFFLIAASATIIGTVILKQDDSNLSLIQTQIGNLRLPAIAAAAVALTPMAPAGDQPDLAGSIPVKKQPVPDDKVHSEVILQGEGFWQATRRLLKDVNGDTCQNSAKPSAACARLNHYYDTLTANILVKNGVIKNDAELRTSEPGMLLTIDSSNNLYIDGVPVNVPGP